MLVSDKKKTQKRKIEQAIVKVRESLPNFFPLNFL